MIPKTIIDYAKRAIEDDSPLHDHWSESLDILRERALKAIEMYKSAKRYELNVAEEKKRIKQWLESVCPSPTAS
jgi:hypothetical protein